MNWGERIEVNPEVLAGKPVVRGTRLAVEFVLELLATGETDILANYPRTDPRRLARLSGVRSRLSIF
ncbi:MAG: DUF433 domain-containing protein [Bryobacteraceae bacterium]|jgi:uncharacterized protein (DUF433 family)